MPPLVLVITGPTATGKTALGVELSQKLNGEVVSADSMQIYEHMDIGTAKPTAEQLSTVPHHMINIVDPDTMFTVSDYRSMAMGCIDDILSNGKQPILVGGTGLYLESLLRPTAYAAPPPDPALRDAVHHIPRPAEHKAAAGAAQAARHRVKENFLVPFPCRDPLRHNVLLP